MRKFLLFLLLVFAPYSIFSQSNSVAGLLQNLQTAATDSIRCEILFKLCGIYTQTNSDSMEIFAFELLKTAEHGGPERFKISGHNAIAMALKTKGDFENAAEHYLAALAIAEKMGDMRRESIVLLNFAELMRLQPQFDRSREYGLRGLHLASKIRDTVLIAKFYINLGLLYENLGHPDSSYLLTSQAHELLKRFPDLEFLGMTIKINLSKLATQNGKLEESANLSREVLEASRKAGNQEHIYLGAHNLSVALRKMGQLNAALPLALEAEAAAKTFHSIENQMLAKGNMVLILQSLGDHKKGLEQAIEYIDLRDTIQKSLLDKNLAEVEARYQNQKKEAEIFEKNLQIEQQQNRQNLLIFSVLLLALTAAGSVFYFKNRQRLREKENQLALQIEHAEAEKLRELDQMKSIFFANISHEFRTPLTLLLGPLREMRDGNFRGNASHFYKIMVRNAERLLQLINQLLDLSKLESGKLKLQPTESDLSGFLRAIVGSFESMATRREMVFETYFPPQNLAAVFDKDVLEKILTNLLSNAFKFSPDESRVVFQSDVIENQLFLKISDEGLGITSEQLPHIFERFFQGNQAANLPDGEISSGIGLALTRELVELCGGNISVESEIGKRTAFTVILPIKLSPDTQKLTVFSEQKFIEKTQSIDFQKETIQNSPLEPHTSSFKTVLVADDNADVRAYIISQLIENYQILEAADGAEALEIGLEKMPDLVITDIMMPKMNGSELTKKLKTDPRTSHIPVVMLTAKAGQNEKIEGLETGADDYLTKPFDGRELQIRVRNLVESRAKLRKKFSSEIRVQPKDVAVNSVDELFLRKIMDAIEQKMDDEQFGVEDLASAAGMSRSQLHRKLTALTDLSPVEIIRKMRLERAHDLLAQGAGNVSEVAYRVGFSSQSYFSRSFGEFFGYTPGEVRQERDEQSIFKI